MGPLETPLYAGIPLEPLVRVCILSVPFQMIQFVWGRAEGGVVKIQGIGQSAGNCSDEAGSSETKCGEPSKEQGFDFTVCLSSSARL